MKSLTIQKALEIGFDFQNSSFENREELEQELFDFLNENLEKLAQRQDECNVIGHGSSQYVNYGDWSSSGEIITYGMHYWTKEKDEKVFHSSLLFIEEDGQPVCMNLFQYVGETEWNAPEGFYYDSKKKCHVIENESI